MHSSASGAQNINAIFFMLGWARCRFHQKHTRTRYTKLVFFHPVRSVGHVVHSSVLRARNVATLFYMLEWDRYGFHKNRVGTH
jgi:hypothetical protein